MNAFRLSALVLCALALAPAGISQALLATAASTLFESTPFILAGLGLTAVASRWSAAVPYLGCGCGTGPAARSLPAAAVTWMLFGPIVALARLGAAALAARLLARPLHACNERTQSGLLEQLVALVPFALATATVLHVVRAYANLTHVPAPIALFGGAALAFVTAPCGLGAVALGASLQQTAPFACVGFLCIAGIADARAVLRAPVHSQHSRRHAEHDAFAYGLAAIACALVAARGGDALVHPRFVPALALCACVFAVLAIRNRRETAARLRWPAVLMLVGAIAGAPMPDYHATETTLSDAFPGERVDLRGLLTAAHGTSAIVRYAITCCRADATPVSVRLDRTPAGITGWVHARGTLVETSANELRLRVDHLEAIAPPADPFIYR